MKSYEDVYDAVLVPRSPIIIRVDGKGFHSYTRQCERPFDRKLHEVLLRTATELCKQVQGTQVAYAFSDEISLLVHPYKSFEAEPWMGGRMQKVCSIAAGIASATFTANSHHIFSECRPAIFDARAFVVPEADVCNYFLWRQQDASRNSVQMLARSMYSHKECHNKNSSQLQEMCFQKGTNWNDIPTQYRRGTSIVKKLGANGRRGWGVDLEIPLFNENRSYINDYLKCNEEHDDTQLNVPWYNEGVAYFYNNK
jgi:tRNA(His) guanylyltransferase